MSDSAGPVMEGETPPADGVISTAPPRAPVTQQEEGITGPTVQEESVEGTNGKDPRSEPAVSTRSGLRRSAPQRNMVFPLSQEEIDRQRRMEETVQYEWDIEEDDMMELRSPIRWPRPHEDHSGKPETAPGPRMCGGVPRNGGTATWKDAEMGWDKISVKEHLEQLQKKKREDSEARKGRDPHQERVARKLMVLTEELRTKNEELLGMVRESAGAPPLPPGMDEIGKGEKTTGEGMGGYNDAAVPPGAEAQILLRVITEKNKEIRELRERLEIASAVSNQTSKKVEDLTAQMTKQSDELARMKELMFSRMIDSHDGQIDPEDPKSGGMAGTSQSAGELSGHREKGENADVYAGRMNSTAAAERIEGSATWGKGGAPTGSYPNGENRSRDHDARARAPQFPVPISNSKTYSDATLGMDGRYRAEDEVSTRQAAVKDREHRHALGHLQQVEQRRTWDPAIMDRLSGDPPSGELDVQWYLRQSADTYCTMAQQGKFEKDVDEELRRAMESEEDELQAAASPVTVYPPDNLKYLAPDFSPVKRVPPKDATWFETQLDESMKQTRRAAMKEQWPAGYLRE